MPASAEGEITAEMKAEMLDARDRLRKIHSTRPVRLDGPLRIENISDIEVRQIESVMQERFPGAIVNIGGVTSGCPCEDGDSCDAQVWVVASYLNRSNGLMLSNIDDEWRIGPLQGWWLRYDSLRALFWAAYREKTPKDADFWRQFEEREKQLQLEFPFCPSE